MSVTLGELAVRTGCELRGDPSQTVNAIGTLQGAVPGQITFLANPRLRTALAATRASAVVLDEASASSCPTAALITEQPHPAFARMAEWLHPAPPHDTGLHASAVVADDVQLGEGAGVGALAVIGRDVRIGARSWVGPGCVLADGVRLGEDVRLVARVTVGERASIGARSLVHPGAVIGADGFGYAAEAGEWLKVPQIGTVRIGADVEIGANTTIDRGAIDDTVIEDGVKLDNLIQVGHNVRIGAHTAAAGCVGIAGSAAIGARCQLAGQVGVSGHVTICDDVVVLARGLVAFDITEPGVYSCAIAVEKAADWRRIAVRLRRLDELARKLSDLQRAPARRAHMGRTERE